MLRRLGFFFHRLSLLCSKAHRRYGRWHYWTAEGGVSQDFVDGRQAMGHQLVSGKAGDWCVMFRCKRKDQK
jgi:hypothetical protein